MSNFNFNLNEIKEQERNFDPIPAGKYPARIESVAQKESRSGGKYLSVCFEIIGDKYAGRKIFNNFNHQHIKPEVVQIALSQIKEMCNAVGYYGLFNDPNQIINKTLILDVTIKTPDPKSEYPEPFNNIRKFISQSGSTSPKPTVSTSSAQVAATVDPTKPWAKAAQ